MAGRKMLGEILVETAGLTPEQVQRGLQTSQKKKVRIGEALVSHGWVTQEQVTKALCRQNGFPFVNLETPKGKIPADVIAAVTAELAAEFQMVPVARKRSEEHTSELQSQR